MHSARRRARAGLRSGGRGNPRHRKGPLPPRSPAERIGITATVEAWAAADRYLAADLVISALPPQAADALAPLWTPGASTLIDVAYRPWPSRAEPAGLNTPSRTAVTSEAARDEPEGAV